MLSFLLNIAIISGFLSAHPVHIAIVNAEIQNNQLQMTLRTYADDLQVAYFHYHSREIDYNSNENLNSKWLINYVKNSITIISEPEKDTIDLQINTVNTEQGSVIFELTGQVPDQANSLYIYNGFLMDIYSDQSNLMIFTASGKERGMKFDIRNQEQVLKLRQ